MSRYENRVFTPAGLPGDGVNRLNSGTNVIAHYNKVFSPTFLFDFTFGYNRSGIPFHNVPLGDAFNSEAGSQYFLTLPQGAIPVGQALSGSRYSQGTWVSYELANPDYTYQYHGDFKKVKGRHEMGFGFRYARYRHIAETQGAAS